jgi:Zn-dependent metalloprotease
LEIIAHELGHGVTSNTSKLKNIGESAALSEAFADMAGKHDEELQIDTYLQQKPPNFITTDLITTVK